MWRLRTSPLRWIPIGTGDGGLWVCAFVTADGFLSCLGRLQKGVCSSTETQNPTVEQATGARKSFLEQGETFEQDQAGMGSSCWCV